MSQQDPHVSAAGTPPFAGLLTPQASAIAAMAFAVLSMTGFGGWERAVSALWGQNFPQSGIVVVLAAFSSGTLLAAVAGLVLGRRAMRSPGWEGHLGRAAVLVAAIGGVLAAVSVLLNIAHSA